MRIMLFAAGGDIGGGKTHILSLAGELSKQNELRLVSFRIGVLADEAKAMGIDTVVVDAAAGYSYAIKQALAQYDEFRPDIVHCHGAKANMLGVILKRKRGACVITTVHSDPKLDYLGAAWKQYTYGVVNELSLKQMDYYVAVAGGMKKLLIERKFDPCSIYTVYNGLDFSGASSDPKPEKTESDEIVVGIAARLTAVKDIETLLRAFAKAYAQDPRLRLSIAGGGEDKKALIALAGELGISAVTTFEGWIDDIKAYFERIDINVLASLSETFPYSLLEGAYVHCPAIATNVGGIPYLIEHGVTGYLFEPKDADAFASYILKLAADPQLRRRLAEALFQKASSEFSLAHMAATQQEIYRSILHRKQAPARYGAVLCGAYGKGNAGDEAIMRAILSELREIDRDMPFWVMSRSPMETSKKEGIRSFFTFDILRFFRSLKHCELFVNGGGTLIQDVTSTRSLLFYLFTLRAAKNRGCKVIMYGCGIGPIGSEKNRRRAAKILNEYVDIISLRDSGSAELLKEIGVTRPEIILAADPTVALPLLSEASVDAAYERERIPSDVRMAGFALREWKTFTDRQAIADAAQYAYKKYGLTPVFIPFESPRDTAISREFSEQTKAPGYVFSQPHSSEELIGMLGRMDLVVGMRLHSLIFATTGGASVIGLSYDPKVRSFIEDIGSSAVIDVEELSKEALCAEIDRVMAAGKEGAQATRRKLIEAEKRNRLAVSGLLNRK